MKDNMDKGSTGRADAQSPTKKKICSLGFSAVVSFGLAVAMLLWSCGCDRDNNTSNGHSEDNDASAADGGVSTGGSGGETGGSGGASSGGSSGDDAGIPSDDCPPNIALPAICRLCRDGSCGVPVCSGGAFVGEWKCPEDEPVDCDCMRGAYVPVCGIDGETYDATCGRECVDVQIACSGPCPCADCVAGGCSGQLCVDASNDVGSTCEWLPEYACYQTAVCERQADGRCGWTSTPQLTQCLQDARSGNRGALQWYLTCGDPVCGIHPDPYDDPDVRNCSTEEVDDFCTIEGDQCDGVAGCGISLICAASDPTLGPGGCPISRARYKEHIAYLNDRELLEYRDQLLRMPLASYQYKHAAGAGPQLGFIIEDIEPSVAVSGDRVNLYGYLSMAVAAIKVQQSQIASLQREIDQLRSQGAPPSDDLVCMP